MASSIFAGTTTSTKNFFRQYYAPNNATIVIAGAVKADSVRRLVRQMFAEIPRGPAITRPSPAPFAVRDTLLVAEDRVQLPRVYMAWHGVKAFHADDAALDVLAYLLSGARNSRLTSTLVYDREIAQSVVAYNGSKKLDGDFNIIATARPGLALDTLRLTILRELQRIASEGPSARELEQAKNATESGFLNRLEFITAKADQLNSYYHMTGQPDYFARDLARYHAVTADDVKRVAATYLLQPHVTLSIVPRGQKGLAATKREIVQ